MNIIISNQVTISRDNVVSALFATADSGRIIYRKKVDTIIGIMHPGIVLGEDQWGTIWVVHNHYKIGHANIVTLEDFAIGEAIFYDNRIVNYNRNEIVERAIYHWLKKERYDWLVNNCQHFVNKVAKGKKYSESIGNITNNVILAGGITALIGVITGNKNLLNLGITITTGGAMGKGLNRLN